MNLELRRTRRVGVVGIGGRRPGVARGPRKVRYQRPSWHGKALRIGAGGRGGQHVVSLGYTTRVGMGRGQPIRGHRVPLKPSRPVPRCQLLLQHSRGWPSAADLKSLHGSILIAALLCLARHGPRSAYEGIARPI